MNLFGVADTNCIFALTDVEGHGHENDSSVLVTGVLEKNTRGEINKINYALNTMGEKEKMSR
jgi:hypothetical protein